jgi:HEAT repeat protein
MEQPPQPEAPAPEQQLKLLLERLATCGNNDTYLILARQAAACANVILSGQEPYRLLPLLELLAAHENEGARSITMREHARFALEQIITGGYALQFVLEQTGRDSGISKRALRAVLRVGGAAAIAAAIEMMGSTGSFKVRKTLSTTLGNLGEAAVPVLISLMNDSRWFITRNICAILGSIASREALTALTNCLHHPDLRVRKEAIRSLARLGGPDAEAAIVSILRGSDTALYAQTIASLGGIKSKSSVGELMQIVFSRDLFLKSLPIKIDALAAIASIGDRQVTPQLVTLFEERYLLAAARGKRLKAAIAHCLGRLGDPRSVPHLKRLAANDGEVGSACSEAIAQIKRTGVKADGIS